MTVEAPDRVPVPHFKQRLWSELERLHGEQDQASARRARRGGPGVAVAATAAGLALVVGVVAIAANRDGNDNGGQSTFVLTADAGLEPGPQHLLLGGWSKELLPDGEVVDVELAGLDPSAPPRFRPGGGHVVVGAHPVDEPVPDGFDEMTDITYGLAVVDAGGRVEVERDIEPSRLVGLTDDQAILAREPRDKGGDPAGPVRIVAHDLATGDERLVREGVGFDPDVRTSAATSVVGHDLVTVEASMRSVSEGDGDAGRVVDPDSYRCTLRVTDLATGDETDRPLDLDCGMLLGLQVAPDGTRAAVAYETAPFPEGSASPLPEVRLAVIDLPDGTVGRDQRLGLNVLFTGDDCGVCPPDTVAIEYEGMAWDDPSTLRLATIDPNEPFGDPTVTTLAFP